MAINLIKHSTTSNPFLLQAICEGSVSDVGFEPTSLRTSFTVHDVKQTETEAVKG